MIQIREAGERDAQALAWVHVESWKSTYRGLVPDSYLDSLERSARADDFRDWFKEPGDRFLLAAFNPEGELAGFVSGGKERENHEPGTGELYAIYLLEEYQRQGIGRMLFSACSARLKKLGYRRMILYSMAGNSHRWFYASLGGTQETCVKRAQIGGKSFNLSKFFWAL
jgi:ribosomal protein S18 acetylase RimI-like enzyme